MSISVWRSIMRGELGLAAPSQDKYDTCWYGAVASV